MSLAEEFGLLLSALYFKLSILFCDLVCDIGLRTLIHLGYCKNEVYLLPRHIC